VNANGRRIAIPAGAIPEHLHPCDKCGRLLPEPGVCGACFGSVCSTDETIDTWKAEIEALPLPDLIASFGPVDNEGAERD
jgi:hypothetical protein